MRLLRLIAAAVVTAAAISACSLPDCAYYGAADADVGCTVVGPAPTGGGH